MTDTSTTVGPAQPQTTVDQSPGGPFIRYTEPGAWQIYDLTAQAFGALITQPLRYVPGYVTKFRLKFVASGGVNGNSSNTTAAADAPENVVQNISLRDANGTPIMSGPGYEMLRLVPMFSGGFGILNMADPHSLPSYSAIAGGTTSAGTGNFTFATALCLEFVKGYGVLGMADANVLPTLTIQLNPSSSVYTTGPQTNPTLEVRVNADFYWIPQDANVAPMGLGTSRQWFLQVCNPTIGNAANVPVQITKAGGWLDTIILIMRDSTNARIDGWPSIFRWEIDGIGTIVVNLDQIYDDMALNWPNVTRPTGVIALTRKTGLLTGLVSLLDDLEAFLSTSPGTSLVLNGSPWGTVSNAPATLSAILGQIIPTDELIQGLQT